MSHLDHDLDHELSPFTGLTRQHWAEHADRLLLDVRPHADESHARIRLPGPTSRSGEDSDCLEAFARTFLTAGFRLLGEDGADPHGFADWYAAGLDAGTDPSSPSRWPRPGELGQAKVEAASLALVLDLTRPWIWDRLAERVQQQVVDWFGSVVGQDYPRNNWQWFRIVTESFTRSEGGAWSEADFADAFELHTHSYVGGGWYTDGEGRNFDHYAGWAWHLYPLLWAGLHPDHLAESWPPGVTELWRNRLADYVEDAVHLVGADGSPLMQGRSLIYRHAAAAPLWMSALTGAGHAPLGQIRRACSGMLAHFDRHSVPDADGLLSIGWHHPYEPMRQLYSGFGSPYWASKGLLGLALPADHPVWTEPEQPLPHEQSDTLRAVSATGWLVSGTRADGVARVINHGTDHAEVGAAGADAPVYARLGYSTATAGPVGEAAATRPVDNAVVLLDAEGRASHRTGFEALVCRTEGDVGVAASGGPVHWLSPDGTTSGYTVGGELVTAGEITVWSLVRAGVEVRVAVLGHSEHAVAVELSGWPVTLPAETFLAPGGDAAGPDAAGPDAAAPDGSGPDAVGEDAAGQDATRPDAAGEGEAVVQVGELGSLLVPLTPGLRVSEHREEGTTMLGAAVGVPVLTHPIDPAAPPAVVAAVVAVGGPEVLAAARATRVVVELDRVEVTWADGQVFAAELVVQTSGVAVEQD